MFKFLLFFFISFLFTINNISAQTGRILLEYWNNVEGSSLSVFSNSVLDINHPSGRMFPSSLEALSNAGENYANLFRGYVHPPSSGGYIFWMAGDDKCELWISTDENPNNKKRILAPTVNAAPREWTKSATQKSSSINLVKGRKYYIEVLHKEDAGEDNIAVGWTLPDQTLERPIPGKRLSPFEINNTIPPSAEIFSKLSAHPRLQASKRDFEKMKNLIANEQTVNIWHKNIRSKGNALLDAEVSEYEKPDGIRLLNVCRKVLDRVIILTYLYQTELDSADAKKYANRAWLELLAASKFQDWNPSHFLDVAEMTYAFALGYDRLYSYLNASQKNIIKNAIIRNGFDPFLHAYSNDEWWTTNNNNWNYVCNSGLALGALAIGDETDAKAKQVLLLASRSIKDHSIHSFGPDGGWEEGPMYWAYAIDYLMSFISGIETALGGDLGFSKTEGLSEAGSFPMYLTGAVNQLFNFGDCTPSISCVDEHSMFYLAHKFDKHEYSWFQNNVVKGITPYNIIWYDEGGKDPKSSGYQLDKLFKKIGVVSMRTSWNDEKSGFVGFKAGHNAAGHSNLDNGTFVFDVSGKRWALDLGSDEYTLPGYFGDERWDFYKKRAEGQNTLVLNPSTGPDQDPTQGGEIIDYNLNSTSPYSVADLTNVYKGNAEKVLRGIKFINRKSLLIQDEITSKNPLDLWWFMHTEAGIHVSEDGKSAILSMGTEKLIAKIISGPSSAKFFSMGAVPLASSPNPVGQNPNEGINKLTVHVKGVYNTTLAILLSPYSDAKDNANLSSLESWNSPLAVEEELNNNLEIYPNPAQDVVNIKINSISPERKIVVKDILSKIVYTKTSLGAENSIELNVVNFTPGIYTVDIYEEDRILTKKFTIVR